MEKYDAIIIGFGKGGKTLAGYLGTSGKKVALIERSKKMYGGTCINVGCIPTKYLVEESKFCSRLGGDFEQKAQRYKNAIKKKNDLTLMLRKKNYDKLESNPNITVIDGIASFLSPNEILVKTENDEFTLSGEKIFINTGAKPVIPPIEGLKESEFSFVSEGLLDLEQLPQRLVIIGGGYIGTEFASIYSNFGSQVTMIQDGDVFLPREDREIADEVHKLLVSRGIKILLSAQINKVEDRQNSTVLTYTSVDKTETTEADAILIATGRRPNTVDLNLENAGVKTTQGGAVKTDSHLRTGVNNIWAMGDAAGGLQFTYISLDDFRIVKSDLVSDGLRTTENRGAVPYSVFLEPPFSRCGLSEKEAIEAGYNVKICKIPASAIPKAQVLSQAQGLLKAVIDADTNMILGAHFFCAESHEMINTIKIAMDAQIPYTVLRDSIYTHPTMSEVFNELFAAAN